MERMDGVEAERLRSGMRRPSPAGEAHHHSLQSVSDRGAATVIGALQRSAGNHAVSSRIDAATGPVRAPSLQRLGLADLDNLLAARQAGDRRVLMALEPEFLQRMRVEAIIKLVRESSSSTPVDEKLVRHYGVGGGAALVLSVTDMEQCLPVINLFTAGFPAIWSARNRQLEALSNDPHAPEQSDPIIDKGLAVSGSRAGLGTFTAHVIGTLVTHLAREAAFSDFTGTVRFEDYWDFDAKPLQTIAGQSGRTATGELLTDILAVGLPGQPFAVTSDAAPIHQVAPGDDTAILG